MRLGTIDILPARAPAPTDQVSTKPSAVPHLNFSVFKERGTALGWMLLDPAASSLIQGDVPIEESDVGDPEGVPDADALD